MFNALETYGNTALEIGNFIVVCIYYSAQPNDIFLQKVYVDITSCMQYILWVAFYEGSGINVCSQRLYLPCQLQQTV